MIRSVRTATAVVVLLASAPLALVGSVHAETRYVVSDSVATSAVPQDVAVDEYADRVYVSTATQIVVLDGETHQVVRTIDGYAGELAVDPDRQRLYVTSGGGVSELSTTDYHLVRSYDLGGAQELAVARSPFPTDNHDIYVSDSSGAVDVINPVPTTPTITRVDLGGGQPIGVAVDSSAHRAFVARYGAGDIKVLSTDTNTVVGTIDVPGNPYKMSLDASTHRLYTTDFTGRTLSVVNAQTNALVTTIGSVATHPRAVAVDSARQVAYVTSNDASVAVLDLTSGTRLATVSTDSEAHAIAVDPMDHDVFVPQYGASKVDVISRRDTAAQTITVTPTPHDGVVGDVQEVSATGGDSGNPVIFTLGAATTHSACTVTDHGDSTATITFAHAGTCVVDADQAGSAGYDPAHRELTLDVAVGSGPGQGPGPYYVSSMTATAAGPDSVAVDEQAGRAYVATSTRTEVIDTDTHQVVHTIGGISGPLAVDPDRQRLYVLGGGGVTEIATTDFHVVHTYDVEDGAELAVAVNPFPTDNHDVYVTNPEGSLTVIDPTLATPTVTHVDLGGGQPIGVAVDSADHRVLVARYAAGDLKVLSTDTNAVVATVDVDGSPYQTAYDESAHRFYTTDFAGGSVSVVDARTSSLLATVHSFGTYLRGIAVDPSRQVAFVTSNDSSVGVLDLGSRTRVATVNTDSEAHDVAVDPISHEAFVPQHDASEVQVISRRATTTQSITFTTPPKDGKIGAHQNIAATGGGSGNPVTFTATTGACTVTDHGDSTGTVTYVDAGLCTIQADQAGSSTYDPAPSKTVTTTVRGTQTVSFTSAPPSPGHVGGTYDVTTSGSPTGLPVYLTIAKASSNVCQFAGRNPAPPQGVASPATVTFTGSGKCVITAQQKGSKDYTQSKRVRQTVTVKP